MLLSQSVIRIVLDVREVESQVMFTVTQSDTVRKLIVNLCDKGKPYVIGPGCYAIFSAVTSKGTGIARSCKIEGNEIIYELTANDVAVVGRTDCDITLFGASGESITSPSFIMNVYKSKIVEQSGEIVASEDFTALSGLIGEANSCLKEINDVLESNGKTLSDAYNKAIGDIDKHASDVIDSMPDTYVDVAYDVAKVKKEFGAHPTGTLVIDKAEGYIKTVHSNSLPVARINQVGGKTFKDGSVLKSAEVTEIKSVGVSGEAVATLLIPESVRNIDGYGWGVNESVYNYIDWEKKQFVKRVGAVDIGTLNWWQGSIPQRFGAEVKNAKHQGYAVCAIYDIRSENTNKVAYLSNMGSYVALVVEDHDYTNVASFKSAMSGVMLYYELATPIITDISDVLPFNNFIEVEGGGTLTFVNEHGYAVPSEITYYLEVVSGVFEGDSPALKVGDTIITQEQIKALLNGSGVPGAVGVAARIGEVTILANKWVGEESPYSQVVAIGGVTENSQVDLTPSVEQLTIFYHKDLAFVTENDGGVVTVYAIGEKPENDYTIQVTITEVEV